MQPVSAVSRHGAPAYWAVAPVNVAAKKVARPLSGPDSPESQAWLWSATKATASQAPVQTPQTGSRVLMRALINLLEATIGNSTPPVDPGAEALPRSAFPIVNQNGNPMMDAYLRQQWVQRMKNSLQRIAADLRGGPTTSGIAAQSDLQALFAGLDGAGGDQAEEAALIRSLVGGLSDSLTGSEDARPGSVISVYA